MVDNRKLQTLKEQLRESLPTSRYLHTIGVAYTAAALAMKYDIDIDQALTAGLLHDCAKCYKHGELIELCKKAKIKLTDEDLAAPQIIHAIYGAYMAEHTYNIVDKDIVSAIRWHTTGHEDMTMLEKIVFTADYIEPGRCEAEDLKVVRPLAFKDITKTVYIISRDTLKYLDSQNIKANSNTNNCYKWIKEHEKYDI